MESETMDLEQLAAYLHRDVREVSKMASRGYLPGQKVGGEWRFASAEINYWIETQMPRYSEEELLRLETGAGRADKLHEQPLIATYLSQSSMAVPLTANTKAAVLKGLVTLAEQTWQVRDPVALLAAVKSREEMESTALENGVAIPHPRRPNPTILGESVIAYGRTSAGIPFGGASGGLADIFFLVCCRDHTTHVSVLARLSRLFLRPGFLDQLRAADTVQETWKLIEKSERELLAEM